VIRKAKSRVSSETPTEAEELSPAAPGSYAADPQLVRALDEALGSFLTPSTRERVLWLARAAAGTPHTPGDPRSLRAFVAGPLRKAISELTDSGVATALMDTLAPVLAMAQRSHQTSTVRLRETPAEVKPEEQPPIKSYEDALRLVRKPERDAVSSAPGMSTIPIAARQRQVLLTTSDPTRAQRLSNQLGTSAHLTVMEDAMALLLQIEMATNIDVIVVDCVHASVQPATMLTLSDDLHPNTRVLLWGAAPELGRELVALSVKANSWLRAPSEMNLDRVGILLQDILKAD